MSQVVANRLRDIVTCEGAAAHFQQTFSPSVFSSWRIVDLVVQRHLAFDSFFDMLSKVGLSDSYRPTLAISQAETFLLAVEFDRLMQHLGDERRAFQLREPSRIKVFDEHVRDEGADEDDLNSSFVFRNEDEIAKVIDLAVSIIKCNVQRINGAYSGDLDGDQVQVTYHLIYHHEVEEDREVQLTSPYEISIGSLWHADVIATRMTIAAPSFFPVKGPYTSLSIPLWGQV